MKRREFIIKSTFAGLALTSAAPLLGVRIAEADPNTDDPTSVLHYNFTKDPGAIAKDLSSHNNDGKIANAQWIAQNNDQPGALRFKDSSWIDCGQGDPVRINGDMTMEMWIRLNRPISEQKIGHIFLGTAGFQLSESQYSTIAFYYNNSDDTRELMVEPVDNRLIDDEWAHVAIVAAYPRIHFYRDGKLWRDAYMPFPGIDGSRQNRKTIGNPSGGTLAMDLREFRLYRRALMLPEIQSHAQQKTINPPAVRELAVEPDWYHDHIAVRFTSLDEKSAMHDVEISLKNSAESIIATQQIKPADVSQNNSGRYVATAIFPLNQALQGKTFNAAARIENTVTAEKSFTLNKPEWIHTKEGYSQKVLSPWIPVKTNVQPGKVRVGIWGRTYDFGPEPFLQQITTKDQEILDSPITLSGQINEKKIQWAGETNLKSATDTEATVQQTYQSNGATLHISAKTEYDGYTIYTCELKAMRDLDIRQLKLDIPLKSQFATLCYGDRVLPEKNSDLYTEWYSGAVKGPLSFQFSPNIWLGNEELGLTWQAESDQYWHNADSQKAIEILPQGKSTFFRANFVDTPIHLAAGQSLQYRFALLATPIKPLKRDAWSWRIAIDEPQGADLTLPDRKAEGGKSILDFYRGVGIKNLYTNASDIWPWPMPRHQQYTDALHRMITAAHRAGIRIYPYLIHQRFPVMVPEFDIYGLNMANRPLKTYVESTNPPGSLRPGPLALDYGANSQGCVFMCCSSMAMQDAYIYSLAQRLKIFGDDGVYLDGTVHIGPLCENHDHGDGYLGEDGKIHGTYPTFAIREFMKRIYTVVKEHDPDGIVDAHCSWGWNPAGLAYADVQWNGEQFGPRFQMKGVPDGYIPSALTLEQFRTEFTGRQLGIGAEMLTYRLGKPNLCAAIALLHDISPRLYTNSFDNFSRASDPYYASVPKIWKMRDEFGMEQAQKYFYWNNQDYVTVGGQDCYATLFNNTKTGVLCLISNLSRDHQEVTLHLDLNKLGLAGQQLKAFNPLTQNTVSLLENGQITIPMDSLQWMYVWIKPAEK